MKNFSYRKNRHGFTIVELVVVITVIALISVATVLAYTSVQKQSRDAQRLADATVLSESLERYYAANGEYPSVAKVTTPNATTVQSLLGLNNLDGLIASNAAPGSTTNIWKAGNASVTNKLAYSPKTDPNPTCQTTGVCIDYKIQYYKEHTGTVETINSRHTAAAAPTPPPAPVIGAPGVPTLTAVLSGANVVATRSGTSCNVGAQALYSFRTRTNNGTWSSYSAWDDNTTAVNAAANQGVRYGFQVKAKCLEGDYSSSEVASTEATYTHPINTPAAPGVYTTASFRPNYHGGLCIDASGAGNVSGTPIQVYNCNASAAQDWAYNSNDRTIRPTYNLNLCIAHEGGGVQFKLRDCNGSAVQQWNYDTAGRIVSAPTGHCMDAVNWGGSGTPIAAGNCNGATAQIWNPSDPETAWTWPNTACPAGTTVEYRVNHQMTNTADSGWISNGTTPRLVRGTLPQGYTYTTQVGTRCYSAFTTSAWSANGASSINKAVLRPGGVSGWAFGVWGDRRGYGWSWDSPACGAGTNRSYIEESWMGVNNNPGGGTEYWLAPRVPNGPGAVWWYTHNASSGADYIWYAPFSNGRGESYVSHPSSPITHSLDVVARALYRCHNPVTGREASGDWSQSAFYYT